MTISTSINDVDEPKPRTKQATGFKQHLNWTRISDLPIGANQILTDPTASQASTDAKHNNPSPFQLIKKIRSGKQNRPPSTPFNPISQKSNKRERDPPAKGDPMAANLGEQSTLPPRTRLFAACNKTTKHQTRGGHIHPGNHWYAPRVDEGGRRQRRNEKLGTGKWNSHVCYSKDVHGRTGARRSKQRQAKKAATLSRSRRRRRDFRRHRRRGDGGRESGTGRGRRESEKVGMDFRVIKMRESPCWANTVISHAHTLTSSSTIFCFFVPSKSYRRRKKNIRRNWLPKRSNCKIIYFAYLFST